MSLSFIDTSIVLAYILITIFVGYLYGQNIKNFKEYAVGDQGISVSVLTMTIFASVVGGNSIIGTMEQICASNVWFIIVPLGIVVYKIISARYIVPRMIRFNGKMTVGDLLETKFGKSGRIMGGIAVVSQSIGSVATQVAAMGGVVSYFFGFSFELSAIGSSIIVILYSAYGGVKSVVMTDVVQFIVLIVAIPLMCVVGLEQVGGLKTLSASFSQKHLEASTSEIMTYASLFIISAIPTMSTSMTQRMLMSKDVKVLSKSFYISAFLQIPFLFVVLLLSVIVIYANPGIDGKSAFPYIVDTMLPVGLKGIAISGILAVIMSSADTILNATSVTAVKDIFKPIFDDSPLNTRDLLLTKIITLFIGCAAVVVSIYFKNIFYIFISSYVLWIPVILFPIYAVVFNLDCGIKDFMRGAITGFVTWVIWKNYIEDFTYINALLPAFIMNGLAFTKGKLRICHEKIFDQKEILVKYVTRNKKTLVQKFYERLEKEGPSYEYIGWFGWGIYTFPTLFFFGEGGQGTDHIYMRFALSGICALLFLKKWCKNILYIPHATLFLFVLIICFSAYPAYLTLENPVAANQIMLVFCYYVMGSATDAVLFFILSFFGFGVATVLFALMNASFSILSIEYFEIMRVLIIANLLNTIFGHSREKKYSRTIDAYREYTAKFVHEIRTPLQAIALRSQNLINDSKEENVLRLSNEILKTVDNVFKYLTMTLNTVMRQQQSSKTHKIYIGDLYDRIVETFPFSSQSQREMLSFVGERETLITTTLEQPIFCNIFHNLIKNSYQAIDKKCKKGSINVSFIPTDGEIIFSVYDTGCGISLLKLGEIFDTFYTTKEDGLGVGLSVCKNVVEGVGGKIICNSQEGEWTEFIIKIPVAKSKMNDGVPNNSSSPQS